MGNLGNLGLDQHNANPKPFVWRNSADLIIEAVGRAAGKLFRD